MKKHYYLFFLFLLITINSAFAQTGYYMEFSADYTEDILQQKFNTTWQGYTPQIESIQGNIVYFQTEKDVLRAFVNPSYSADSLFVSNVDLYINNELTEYTIYKMTSQTSKDFNYTSYSPCGAYLFGSSYGKYLYSGSNVYLDGVSCWGSTSGTVYGDYNAILTNAGTVSIIANYDSTQPPNSIVWLVAKGAVDIPTANQRLVTPLPRGTIKLIVDDCNLKIGGKIQSITNNTELYVPVGTYTLEFSKAGFWNESRTLTVIENETINLNVDLFPESSIFKISQLDTVNTYQNNEFVVKMNVAPVQEVTSVRLEFPTTEAVSVRKGIEEITKNSDNIYQLGTIGTEGTELTLRLPAGALTGSRYINMRITGADYSGELYVQNKMINYNVQELPIQVDIPSLVAGNNNIKITDKSGGAQRLSILLKDEDTNVYSKDYDLGAYQSINFDVDLEVKDYILTISTDNYEAKYTLNIKNAVIVPTKSFEISKGSELRVPLQITNPYPLTKYYTVKLQGTSESCLTNNTELTYSIAPQETKTVYAIANLKDSLQYDSYSTITKVILDNEEIHSETITINIKTSGFIPIIDDENGISSNTLIIGGITIIILGGGILYLRSRKKGKKVIK
ncbi:carboxypeptidase-like regulatory domain-containing protein [Methanococcus voltae]|uniref:PEGA domain-containing protein n=1 Tax=Methanococcus voltae (strain ATCC BAA-1334 / A3) TaxID=456320 RepID=D7DS64_METV3|nr:carboxypeptidase regulatory-like domain-containing protein [Methanococcus voltae]MCS3901500.1 hypothetical protein [Methanococcus voltae]